MKKKFLVAILVAGMLGMSACGDGGVNVPTVESESSDAVEKEVVRSELYELFLADEALMYSQMYSRNVENTIGGEVGYSLSALIEGFKDWYYGMQEPLTVEYAYIDCGNDGVEELAVRFVGMGIYEPGDDSTVVYIIKEIDGQLEFCYKYQTWARSETTLNKYGYVTSRGSNGASNHGFRAGYIDGTGKWNYLYYTEEEADINQLAINEQLKNLPVVAASKSYEGNIYVATTTFEEMVGEEAYLNTERFYTYYVDGVDGDVYLEGVYKEIFDEAGVKFYRPEEIDTMILEKETTLGITEEIKNAPEITWEKLDK